MQEVKVVATTVERPRPAMPITCHADKREKFKAVAKKAGDQTEAAALAHALQSNKSRLARNELAARDCECFVASEAKNADDLKRLEGQCTPPPPAEPPPKTT